MTNQQEAGTDLLPLRGGLVGTMLGIEADIGQAKAFDGTTVQEVFVDDLLDVLEVDEAVPDGLRIDHDYGSVLALVEATGLVGADVVLKASFLDGILECRFKLFAALGQTAGPRGAFVALVGADEDVVVKLWHWRGSLPWPP